MERTISIAEFIRVIKRLPEDEPVDAPRKWYKTQKEHWLGWLGEYEGPGAYGRKVGVKRDARFAYNHVVCPELLMYLICAIPLGQDHIEAAKKAYDRGLSEMEKSGAIRKIVPWSEIYQAIWGNRKPSLAKRMSNVCRQNLEKQKGKPDNSSTGLKSARATTGAAEAVQNRAISIRQPYAEQILCGTKKIEYRSIVTHIRGRVYIYASQKPKLEAYQKLKITPGSLPTGVIVGTVEIVGCDGSNGDYEWHLANPERLDQPIKPERHPQPIWFMPFEKP